METGDGSTAVHASADGAPNGTAIAMVVTSAAVGAGILAIRRRR